MDSHKHKDNYNYSLIVIAKFQMSFIFKLLKIMLNIILNHIVKTKMIEMPANKNSNISYQKKIQF